MKQTNIYVSKFTKIRTCPTFVAIVLVYFDVNFNSQFSNYFIYNYQTVQASISRGTPKKYYLLRKSVGKYRIFRPVKAVFR